MRRALPALILLALTVTRPAAAQDPAPPPPAQSEHEQLEAELIRTRSENGESHASGSRPDLGPVVLGNPASSVVALRVGLHTTAFNPTTGAVTTEFSSLHHTFVELSNTDGDVKVVNRADGKAITVMTPGSIVRVQHDGTGFLVLQDGIYLGTFDGPVYFRPTSSSNLFRVEHIRRTFGTTQVPRYRGAMEVGRGSTTAGLPLPIRINLTNIVEVESYVPGVVANESIASFSVEALKAQAVAARGYAIANIGNYVRRGYPFDIVDSSASQVYRGVISEHVNAVKASGETHGLVASSDGRIISAMYSSSFGGHSEHNEWTSFFLNSTMGGTPLSYLRAIYDGLGDPPDFFTEPGIENFWRTSLPVPQIYDECTWTGNTFSRWRFPLLPATIKGRMTDANSIRIGPTGSRDGTITDIEIAQRGLGSQRAVVLRVTFTTGVYEVRGWEGIRQVIGRTGTQLAERAPRVCSTNANPPTQLPANFVLNNPGALDVSKDLAGNVTAVMVYGGGWGHNLGMSQYGAHGRGKYGQSFIEILKAYYTGVDIGSYPIDIGREPGSGAPTLRQTFVAPDAEAELQIRSQDLAGLRVHINELYDLSFDRAALASGFVSVDISPYLVAGTNVIQYNPVGRDGTATVSVVVR